ncbi:peptide IlvX [Leclercia adecarboxylata]|nr:peptide IlvX [Leclercia adecarboxylata]MEB6381525.1 peptide IlvX [Leclercia adecarboxylata]
MSNSIKFCFSRFTTGN